MSAASPLSPDLAKFLPPPPAPYDGDWRAALERNAEVNRWIVGLGLAFGPDELLHGVRKARKLGLDDFEARAIFREASSLGTVLNVPPSDLGNAQGVHFKRDDLDEGGQEDLRANSKSQVTKGFGDRVLLKFFEAALGILKLAPHSDDFFFEVHLKSSVVSWRSHRGLSRGGGEGLRPGDGRAPSSQVQISEPRS